MKILGLSAFHADASAAAHRFYEGLGYVNIKTQYSFAKPLNEAATARVRQFVPRVDPA